MRARGTADRSFPAGGSRKAASGCFSFHKAALPSSPRPPAKSSTRSPRTPPLWREPGHRPGRSLQAVAFSVILIEYSSQ